MRTMMVIIVRARFQPSDWAVESGMGQAPVVGSGPFPLDSRPAGRGQAAITASEAAAARGALRTLYGLIEGGLASHPGISGIRAGWPAPAAPVGDEEARGAGREGRFSHALRPREQPGVVQPPSGPGFDERQIGRAHV